MDVVENIEDEGNSTMSRNEETATAEYCSGFTKGLVDNVCKKVEGDDQAKEEVKQAPKED